MHMPCAYCMQAQTAWNARPMEHAVVETTCATQAAPPPCASARLGGQVSDGWQTRADHNMPGRNIWCSCRAMAMGHSPGLPTTALLMCDTLSSLPWSCFAGIDCVECTSDVVCGGGNNVCDPGTKTCTCKPGFGGERPGAGRGARVGVDCASAVWASHHLKPCVEKPSHAR